MRFLRPRAAGQDEGAANAAAAPAGQTPAAGRPSLGSVSLRLLMHAGFLVISVGCLAAYAHFKAGGHPTASLASLVAGAVIGFAPLRDLAHVLFGIEGKVLHLVHGLGGLALVGLPLSGVVSGTPVLTHAAMAPFALMGAAQAVMHQQHPRNAEQAAALRRFASSLPEVAEFARSKNFASPENVRRAITVLTDILAKAQALGETELKADPQFQSALSRVCTRVGANLGLDAVALALGKLAGRPGTAEAVPALRKQLAAARSAIAGTGTH